MTCSNECPVPPVFPLRIYNRPALPVVDYRIGDYPRFRAHMLDRLDQSPLLADWTHRGSDDPGIALLEGAAIVADILTFYQSLYANETFLRTARWRESVSRLVQLSGYRMAPGVGGQTTFALTVEGSDAVTVPAGFGFKVKLEGLSEEVVFETLASSLAYPAQNDFRLYRPRKGMQPVAAGLRSLELHAVDGRFDAASLQAQKLQAGDRLLLVPVVTSFAAGGGAWSGAPQPVPEIVILKEVTQVLDRTILYFEGELTLSHHAPVTAYVIGRSFRHFGYNAPARLGRLNETTGMMNLEATNFVRNIYGNDNGDDLFYSDMPMTSLPLDQEVGNLALGSTLICHGLTRFDGTSTPVPFTVVKQVRQLHSDTLVWGGLSGSCTVVTMDSRLIANLGILNEEADIRRLQIHEALSPPLQLRAPSAWHNGPVPVTPDGYALHYYGLLADATKLLDRDLLLVADDGRTQTLHVLPATTFDTAGRDTAQAWLWPLMLDQQPLFPREWFDEVAPRVSVHGNLVATDQGETQPAAVLGGGDARQKFQTLALPKPPLAWHLQAESAPPFTPALELFVNDIRWQRVASFFEAGPHERVYVVCEDEAGTSFVQCGDGITGAVFPSGLNNIAALFRTGNGARGKALAKAKPVAKLKSLKAAWMPVPATGGADPETVDSARAAAPARLQSLGRLVGLADYEAEALALPGVLKARACWTAPSGVPRLQVVILTENAYPAEATAVQQSLHTANQSRGAARHPVQVINGHRRFVMLKLLVGFAPAYRSAAIHQQIVATLGASGADTHVESGLFGAPNRSFGEGVHVSQILAVVQQVDGVNWARVSGFALFPLGSPPQTEPDQHPLPVTFGQHQSLTCGAAELLALFTGHLVINLSADTGKQDVV